jgi:hypothetical protein
MNAERVFIGMAIVGLLGRASSFFAGSDLINA